MIRMNPDTNFILRCHTSTPPAPLAKGGARKVSVASIEEIGMSKRLESLSVGKIKS
jgi:hypothetical protein